MRTSFSCFVTLAVLSLACGKEAAPPAPADPSSGPDGDDWRGPVDRALAAIAAHPEAVSGGPDHSFEPLEVLVEEGGREHVRFDRRFKGLRVLGGDAVTHLSEARLEDASLTLTAPLAPEVTPGISGPDAAVLADLPGAVSELVVYSRGPSSALAYEVAGTAALPDGTPSEPHAIVDARSGEILDRWDGVATAGGTGQGYYSGKVTLQTTAVSRGFSLQDPTRGNLAARDLHGATRGTGALFTDANDVWGDGTLANRQSLAVDAQYG
jgi:Zn-dependent metalloprotease